MEKGSEHFPVVIIGSGPAGLATSLTLSARGVKHCIADARLVPVRKPGEAIPPNAKPLLTQLGIMPLLSHEHHLHYYGNKASWGGSDLLQEEFISDLHGHGYLLDRLLFETQLRKLTESIYCRQYWGYKLRSISKNGLNTDVTIENKESALKISCEYVVDATGRKSSVCRQSGMVKTTLDSQFALAVQVPSRTRIEQQIHVEAAENGWWYAAPSDTSELNLMFFTLRNLIPARAGLTHFFNTQLQSTRFIKDLLNQGHTETNNIKIMPAGTSCLEVPYGDNWLAVGDAAYAYDPISSYGITSGLASGYYGGHALADRIAGKEGAFEVYMYLMESAFQAYLEKLDLHYAIEKRWSTSPYWSERFSGISENRVSQSLAKDTV